MHRPSVPQITANGVLDGLAFVKRTELDTIRGNHVPPKSLHGGFKAESGARAWFVEKTRKNFPFQQITSSFFYHSFHLFCDSQNSIRIAPCELLSGCEVGEGETHRGVLYR